MNTTLLNSYRPLAAFELLLYNSVILHTSLYTGRHLGIHGYALASTIFHFCHAKLPFAKYFILV